jgi:regulator of protease activity HflC (stomatin/prohibitin superfamily)
MAVLGIDPVSVGLGVFILVFLALAAKSIVIIHPYEKGVVERFGKYNRILDSGLNILIPFMEQAFHVDMREAIIDIPYQEVITRDNATVQVDAIIYFKVTDPFKVMYNVAMFEEAVSNLARTSLRNIIGKMDLDLVLGSRDRINHELRNTLDEVTDRWGVRITRVEIQDINPPEDIVDAMSRQMKAERMKRASVLEAEGFRRAEVLRAKGRRDAEIISAEGTAQAIKKVADAEREKRRLVAEGEAKAIERVFNAIHEGDATEDIIKIKYLEALEKMADGQATKIFMPFETSGVLSSVAAMGDMLGEGAKQKRIEEGGEREEEVKEKGWKQRGEREGEKARKQEGKDEGKTS